jgi:hypothetical protein
VRSRYRPRDHRGAMAPNGLHFLEEIPAWVLVVAGEPFAAFMWHESPWQARHRAGRGRQR